MEYSVLKLIHIISSTILFGTGIGTAFYMVMANRSHDIRVLKSTTTSVVFADWIFTTPAVIIQPLTGYLLMEELNYSFTSSWFYLVFGIYVLIGLCWIPVVFIQIKLRYYAHNAKTWGSLNKTYNKLYKIRTQ
ncbi:MAG: DUF2269 domain-containing protein [Proteobacteria bacterium]|nr:DUF2269 domain-containing protein [Pseudomonadota bacterium]